MSLGFDGKGKGLWGIYNDYLTNIYPQWGGPGKACVLHYLPVGPLHDEPMQEILDQTPGIIKITNFKTLNASNLDGFDL